jgi:hypothetical protein
MKQIAKKLGSWVIITEVVGWVAVGVWVYYFGLDSIKVL